MKISLVLIFSLSLLMACNSDLKQENEGLKSENEKLKKEQSESEAKKEQLKVTIDFYERSLKEIENNLATIDESAIKLNSVNKEVKTEAERKKNIMKRINSIRDMMRNSKQKILGLDKNLLALRKENSAKSEEVQKLTLELKEVTAELLEKDSAMLDLAAQIGTAYEQQAALNQQLSDIINRAYYFAGTAGELKKQGIINKEGGFIGIGKTKVINANKNNNLFTRIGKRENRELSFNSKSIQLLSKHPDDSYTIEKSGGKSTLKISDTESFWKQGNYLVVQLN
jgi:predicted RNase H-like nuclease (RuvC/YqgF family)